MALGQINFVRKRCTRISNKKEIIQVIQIYQLFKISCEFLKSVILLLIKRTFELDCSQPLYILCYPDIPWEYDVQRENPFNDRLALFKLYEQEIKKLK